MKLIREPSIISTPSVITIGNCDGMHSAHQTLIKNVVASAKQLSLASVVVLFEPQPQEFFATDNIPARLMRFCEKYEAIKKLGVDYIYCIRFNKAFANLSAEDFVKNILIKKLNAKKIIVGDDFRFGKKRLGDVALLKKLSIENKIAVEVLAQIDCAQQRVSSTRIRQALHTGDITLATTLLNHPFCFSGRVAYGKQMGRKLGFPTANIYLHRKKVPVSGIFVARVHGLENKILPGVASIGDRPTFNGKQILLEVHIFNFDQNIYGKKIQVELLHKIRDEIRFDSVEKLVDAIKRDVMTAQEYF